MNFTRSLLPADGAAWPAPRGLMPWHGLGLILALLLLLLGLQSTLHAAEQPATAPELMHALDRAAEDNPRAALADAQRQQASAQDPTTRFWLWLAIGRTQGLLEDAKAAQEALSQAASALAQIPKAGAHLALWLQLEETSRSIDHDDPNRLGPRMAQLRSQVNQIADPALSCALTTLELWVLMHTLSYDEAWLAAEELERCARSVAQRHLEPVAMAAMGQIKAATATTPLASQQALEYFERALVALAGGSSRFRRSLIEWDMGNSLRRVKQLGPALDHLRNALELSRSLDDVAGVAAAHIAIARVLLEQGSHQEMLPMLAEAQKLLEPHDDGMRLVTVMELRVLALARLKRPEVLAEIERARLWDRSTRQPINRAPMARAMSEAYASQGLYQRAYAELMRANELEASGKSLASNSQVLRLQARYDAARRDAENAELRHRSQAAQLELEAQVAERRSLWAAIAALAMVAAAVGVLAWHGYARRRVLADLALKDELTGGPNRRAVTAYAQAQFEQARRLGLPMTVAMIDLDHFKRVNDNHGHAVGDALLRAFTHAASHMLRGQDRLGRWGGEEWLLVMPGTRIDELPHVFERMRQTFASTLVPGMPAPHGCTFSMGGAAVDADTPSLERAIALADQRLYEAKSGGRNALRMAA